MLRLVCCLALTAMLAGCMPNLQSERPPQRVYWLETVRVPEPPAMDIRLSVVPGLDSDRIWVLQADRRLNFYAGAFWPDNLRPLLESLLSRSLNAGAAGPKVSVLIERFFAVEADPGGAAAAPELVIAARIDAGELGARCAFESRTVSGSERLRDIVAGHQALLDELTLAIAGIVRSGNCP